METTNITNEAESISLHGAETGHTYCVSVAAVNVIGVGELRSKSVVATGKLK